MCLNFRTVCAVIVTFNRHLLLERCLEALLSQTRPCEKIIIIDNASTDDSESYIDSKFSRKLRTQNVEFLWIRQKSNHGGAGGFSEGVKAFLDSDQDFVWLMDDDGFASPDCLENLIKYADEKSFCGPLVLSEDDKFSLAFPFRKPNSLKAVDNLENLEISTPPLEGVVLPFNGTLISRRVVESIGLPEAKYFIWGDEVDYTERAKKAGAKIFTIPQALFFHPKTQNLGRPMFFGVFRFNDPESCLKLYCYCRNNFVNIKKYRSKKMAILFVCKVLWYYSFTRPSLMRLSIAVKAFYHGLSNDFRHHEEFISN